MSKNTEQIKFWQGEFGKEYTERNSYSTKDWDDFYRRIWGVTRSALNEEFLAAIPRDAKILEVGCNVGQQLRHLQLMGFKNLYGIEIQRYAVEKAKHSTEGINIIGGSAFDIPFQSEWFDVVFTSGVLIHIHPSNLNKALSEIYRCSKKFIWGFEYYAPELTEIEYRGNKGVLWKADYALLYQKAFDDLKIVKQRNIKYVQDANVDKMFLLEK